MDTINILGINISTLNKKQVLKKIEQFLAGSGQHQIVTANPEFLLRAGKDEEFFYILNKADLAVPDGIGLKFAAWAIGKNIHRYTGVDLVKDIIFRKQKAESRKQKIVVVNWKNGLSKKEDIEKILREKYENIEFFVVDVDREMRNWIPQNIAGGNLVNFQPDILFVALGAPWQEKWIYHNLPKLSSVKIAIGVGGAFDFLTGKIKRAPKFLRIIGLEWFWRLIKQPWRWRRIYNAVIVFPWQFLKWRFILPFIYRSNVACLLYKRESGKYKILLVLRNDQPEHWQLPQGGIEGENIKTAGERELSEELGTDKFKIIKIFKNVYKYRFGEQLGKYGVQKRIALGYKGQKQSLVIAEFLGEDSDIEINFWDHSGWKWVDSDKIINEVFSIRREGVKIFLEKFTALTKKSISDKVIM